MLGTHHSTVAEDLKYVGNPTDEASGAAPEAKNSGEPVGNPTDEEISSDGGDDVLADEEFADEGEEFSSPEPNPA